MRPISRLSYADHPDRQLGLLMAQLIQVVDAPVEEDRADPHPDRRPGQPFEPLAGHGMHDDHTGPAVRGDLDDLVELLDLDYRVVFRVQDLEVESALSSRRPRILGLHSLELLALVQEAEHNLRPAASGFGFGGPEDGREAAWRSAGPCGGFD